MKILSILIRLAGLFVVMVLGLPVVCAQTAPPELLRQQELFRQQERERQLREQQELTPDVRLPRPERAADAERLPRDETPCSKINGLVLNGDLSESFGWVLQAADRSGSGELDPVLPRCLGSAGINIVMRRIQNALIARGYITTRVLAAPQDLNSGVLSLTLIPGRIHAIRLTEDSSPRARLSNALPVKPGDVLNLRDLEQGLENLKRVPTADADLQIEPAREQGAAGFPEPGASDVVVRYTQAFPLRLNVSADDSGSNATGKYQGNVTLSADHALTLNDLFYVSLNHDLGGGKTADYGTRGFTAHYSVPWGYWLLGATASHNQYHQTVAGLTQNYVYSGTSKNAELKLSQLVYRDARRKITGSLGSFLKNSDSFVDDTELRPERTRSAGWQAGLNHREWWGAHSFDFNLNYRRGTGAFNALPAPGEALGSATSHYKIINADALLNMPFSVDEKNFRYQAQWRAQWNRSPLGVQEHFAIGNRYTVRGFNGELTLAAERGWVVRNELAAALGASGQELYWGFDLGEVGGPTSQFLLGTRLAGMALGWRGQWRQLAWDFFIGRPISKPEGFNTPSSTGGFSVNWGM